LRGADLSGSLGLKKEKSFLSQFKKTENGYIVFKTFGSTYELPGSWKIIPGSEISEVVNPLPTIDCGCGINVATINWVRKNYVDQTIYECLLKFEDLIDCVVPYNTEGKFRAEKVTILRALTEQEAESVAKEEDSRLVL